MSETLSMFAQRMRRLIFNRRSAIVVASLLYMLRTTIFNIIVRGKWVNDLTTYFERRKQLADFQSSEHSSVVQAALYSVSKDRVNKRTLFEEHIVQLLYSNKAAGRAMIRATKLCSRELPFVTQHLDMTHPLLNTVLNKLSSLAAHDHLEYESSGRAGVMDGWEPVWYVFGVLGYSPSLGFDESTGSDEPKTSANLCDRRSTKLRVIIVREDVLQNLSEKNVTMVSERHKFRMNSLIRMKAMYAAQQDSNISSVVDRMAGSISRRHLMRVQIGYRKTSPSNLYRLQSPHPMESAMMQQEDLDSPAMFSPRRRVR
jgi:hypothetical protein